MGPRPGEGREPMHFEFSFIVPDKALKMSLLGGGN
jgi:hypothetical protein